MPCNGMPASSSLITLCAVIKANPVTSGVATFIRIVREPQDLLLGDPNEGTPQVSAPLILRDTGNLLTRSSGTLCD